MVTKQALWIIIRLCITIFIFPHNLYDFMINFTDSIQNTVLNRKVEYVLVYQYEVIFLLEAPLWAQYRLKSYTQHHLLSDLVIVVRVSFYHRALNEPHPELNNQYVDKIHD